MEKQEERPRMLEEQAQPVSSPVITNKYLGEDTDILLSDSLSLKHLT
jgi:hypothetical protein